MAVEKIMNVEEFIDADSIYRSIVVPSALDYEYAGFQSPFVLDIINSTPTSVGHPMGDYMLFGGHLPYNVRIQGMLPNSGMSPTTRTPLINGSGIVSTENLVHNIAVSGTDIAKFTISEADPSGYGITRYEWYDFEGERREVRDFVLNPRIRYTNGDIVGSGLTLASGESISLTYYAGFSSDEEEPMIENIEWGQSVSGISSLSPAFKPLAETFLFGGGGFPLSQQELSYIRQTTKFPASGLGPTITILGSASGVTSLTASRGADKLNTPNGFYGTGGNFATDSITITVI